MSLNTRNAAYKLYASESHGGSFSQKPALFHHVIMYVRVFNNFFSFKLSTLFLVVFICITEVTDTFLKCQILRLEKKISLPLELTTINNVVSFISLPMFQYRSLYLFLIKITYTLVLCLLIFLNNLLGKCYRSILNRSNS